MSNHKIHLLLILVCISATIASGPEHEAILQWWRREASQLKPLKCTIDPKYLEEEKPEILEKLPFIPPSSKLIKSRKCGQNEEEPYFDFKGSGKVIDGVLQGPGKLKLYSKANINAMFGGKIGNGSCLSFNLLNGNDPQEIIGTFTNGLLEGMARVSYTNGKKLISSFENGNPTGFRRTWSENDTLHEVYFYANNTAKGYGWASFGSKYLIYTDASFVSDEPESLSLLVPLDLSKEILVGTFFSPFAMAYDLYKAQVEITSKKEDCILNLKWTKKEKKDFMLSVTYDEPIPNNYEENMSCKSSKMAAATSAKDKFKAWHSHVANLSSIEYGSSRNIFQVKPETSPVEHDKVRQPFMSNFTLISRKEVNISIWNGPILTWEVGYLKINSQGKLTGKNYFKLNETYYNQTGEHDFLNWKIRSFMGMFKNGVLDGPAVLFTWKGSYIFATFKEGVLHGPMFAYGVTTILHTEARGFTMNSHGFKLDEIHGKHGIAYFGRFKNGQAHGNFWVEMMSSGFLHGKVDENGHITGDDLAFIYIDGETAFKGRFEDKFMRKAYNVDVLDYECDENGLLQATKFTEPLSEHIFVYDPCTNESFGGGLPLDVRDPYEVKTVTLAPSSVPNSGEGVFLIRDIPSGQMASLYSLFFYRRPDQEQLYYDNCIHNIAKSDDYRRHCKKYSLGVSMYQATIDLPPEFDVNPLPNHGPKVNHHFRKNNSIYSEIEHPRYGLIQSVTTSRDMKAGEELFTYYGYGKSDFPADFQWYWETKYAIEREERLQSEAEEAKKGKKLKAKKHKSKSKLVK